ncbi:MAG: uroporphyrinogen-III synthase [Deltaproteobacteria bacterium]|nr:uroporphyrinogen-III synthase [Deltaproteobacteria bacterium]
MNTDKPLRQKRILLGRPPGDGSDLSHMLEQKGATVTCVPLIQVEPLSSMDLSSVNKNPDIVVITSKNSVQGYRWLCDALSPHVLAVVGERTGRECRRLGFSPDVVGSGKGALALLDELASQMDLNRKHILYPCSNLVADDFTEKASALGATVQIVPVYRTIMPETLCANDVKGYDATVFYSSSGAENFHSHLPLPSVTGMVAVAMGEQTAATLRQLGATRVMVAEEPGLSALLNAVVESVGESEQTDEGDIQ